MLPSSTIVGFTSGTSRSSVEFAHALRNDAMAPNLSACDLIICDFGGVLYNIDFARTRLAMAALPGYNGSPIHFGVDVQDDLFVQYDRGDVSTDEFRAGLREKFGFTANDDDIDAAWCALLLAPYPSAQEIGRTLRTHARAVLFSNISELHKEKCMPESEAILTEFDELYFSYVIHRRKPALEAFTYVCDTEGVLASRTMLIDDSSANIAAAASLGMQTWHATNADLVRELFASGFAGER